MTTIIQLTNHYFAQISTRVYVTNNAFTHFAVEGYWAQFYNRSTGEWVSTGSGLQVNTSWY